MEFELSPTKKQLACFLGGGSRRLFPIHLPMYCTSRLNKGLDDRRTNPKFGGAATKILVSSQIAQKRDLRVSESFFASRWASESFALETNIAMSSNQPSLGYLYRTACSLPISLP